GDAQGRTSYAYNNQSLGGGLGALSGIRPLQKTVQESLIREPARLITMGDSGTSWWDVPYNDTVNGIWARDLCWYSRLISRPLQAGQTGGGGRAKLTGGARGEGDVLFADARRR